MPNPNPPRRPASTREPTLPGGMRRRANGTLHYRYTEHGRRHDKYGATVEEVLAKRYAPSPAAVVVDERTTLAAYLRLWVDGLALRPNSVATHRLNVEHYLVPLFGLELRLAEVSRELIKARLAELRLRPARGGGVLAPRTVAHAYATLRLALNAAVDDRRLPFNPAARIKPNGTTGAGARGGRVGVELAIPSELEVRRIRKAVAGTALELPFVLSVVTGLRQSEALGLTWGDLDLEARYVRVSRALRRSDRSLDDPKNPSSARFVGLPHVALELLEVRRRAQIAAALAAGERWSNPHELVFTTAAGAPLVGSTLSHQFADACERAGVPRYRWHDLRHFYASTLINAGVPIAVVSKRMGHANSTITSTTYHHLLHDDETGTLEVAERVFR